MRVVLTTFGSVGDIQPFVALACELRRHGHHALFVLPSPLLPYAQQYHFPTIQFGSDINELYRQFQRLFSQCQVARGDREADDYFQSFAAAAPQALQQLREACSTADMLISADNMALGLIAHELTGIPFVSVRLRYTPLPFARRNRTAPHSQDHLWQHLINVLRTDLGLSPINDPTEPYGISPQLVLFPIIPEFLPPSFCFPEHYHVTGFFFLTTESWQPDADLVNFLQAGPAPVVISLGSMIHDDPKGMTNLFIEAIQAVGCRAIIQHGWSGLADNISLPNTIYPIDFVPHSWLFSQAACVVHHGGLGTVAAASRAGVPTIVIAHVFDNLALARRTQNLGVTSAIFSLEQLNVERLAAALSDTLADMRYRSAASALSKRIVAEQGIQSACRIVEQLMEKSLRSTRETDRGTDS